MCHCDARAMGGARRASLVAAAVACAVAVALAAGVDATDFLERVAGWLVRIASLSDGCIAEFAPRGSWANLGLSLLLDAALLLALGPAGPVHRRLAGAGGASAKAALETARGLDTIVDVLYPSGGLRVVASAAAAFAASLGTAGTALFLSVLFALAEGWRMSRVRARRVAANVVTRDLNLEGIRRLGNLSLGASARAPAWAGDVVAAAAEAAIGDVEKVQWWNDIMATAWPNISIAAQAYVRNILEPMLDHDKPPGISEMKFDKFDLGDVPPEIESVAVIPPDEPDEIQIQLRTQWRGAPDVVFKVTGPKIYGGMSPVKIGMTDLTVAGTAKVTLAHLMSELPVVGGVQVTLTEDPTVTYKVAVKAAPGMPKLSLNSIPGLKAAISNAVVHALRDTVVFPKSLNVRLAKFHTPRVKRAVEDALRISPVGRLTVTIKCARGLKNADLIGTSDPYVGVALGSRKVPPQMAGMRDPAKPPADVSVSFLSRATTASRKHRLKTKSKSGSFRKRLAKGAVRTKTVRNDLNPVFDETFVLDVMSTELQCVWIRVFDDDGDYNAHDVMGTVVLPLAGLPSFEAVRGLYALKSTAELDGAAATKSRGVVELALRYEPVEEEGSSGPSFEKNNGVNSAAEEPNKNKKDAEKASAGDSCSDSKSATPFQRNVARWLGVRDGSRRQNAAETIEALLRSNDGSLSAFRDDTLLILARHTPTRMDVGGGVPLWAAYPDFSRVAFANEILLTVWPYAARAIRKELSLLNQGGVLRDHVRHVFARAAAKAGANKVTDFLGLSTDLLTLRAFLDIGKIPPTIEGVRVRRGVADEIVMEWSVKVAGDGFAGGEIGWKHVPNLRLEATASEGQLLAVIRVRLRPLVPRAPIVAGASVSFFGETVVDGRFDVKVPFLPRIDLLCLPPLRFMKFFLLGPTLRKRMTYPAAIHVPVLDFEHPAVKQLTSTTSAARAERHALEISVLSARNLDAADAFGTSDPFVVVALSGEGRYDERLRKTSTKKRTLHPKWFERFTYVVADPKQARDVLFAVFDSDGKNVTARSAAPEKVRAKIAPVKRLHLRALEVSERYLYRATRIPWAKSKKKRDVKEKASPRPELRKGLSLRKGPSGLRDGDVSDDDDGFGGGSGDSPRSVPGSTKQKAASLLKRLAEARAADIARRAAEEPPPPLREETEEEREANDRAAKRAAKAKKKSSSKSLSVDTKKNLAAFNPNRVVSDVEACIVQESVMGTNDLLGAAMVDFAEMCKPGESTRFWLPLEGCPGDAKKNESEKKERKPPELEIELAWRTYDPVSASAAKSLTSRDGDDVNSLENSDARAIRDGDRKHVTGALRVDVSHANDLYKPRSRLFGKMSGGKLTPKVILRVGGQSAETSAGRSANPFFREGFDFFGITALDELVVEVVHPSGRTSKNAAAAKIAVSKISTDEGGGCSNDAAATNAKGGDSIAGKRRTFAPRKQKHAKPLGRSVGDRFMGVATVPLHGVVRSGTTTGTFPLSGVKHGDVTMTLTFRRERAATPTIE